MLGQSRKNDAQAFVACHIFIGIVKQKPVRFIQTNCSLSNGYLLGYQLWNVALREGLLPELSITHRYGYSIYIRICSKMLFGLDLGTIEVKIDALGTGTHIVIDEAPNVGQLFSHQATNRKAVNAFTGCRFILNICTPHAHSHASYFT